MFVKDVRTVHTGRKTKGGRLVLRHKVLLDLSETEYKPMKKHFRKRRAGDVWHEVKEGYEYE